MWLQGSWSAPAPPALAVAQGRIARWWLGAGNLQAPGIRAAAKQFSSARREGWTGLGRRERLKRTMTCWGWVLLGLLNEAGPILSVEGVGIGQDGQDLHQVGICSGLARWRVSLSKASPSGRS